MWCQSALKAKYLRSWVQILDPEVVIKMGFVWKAVSRESHPTSCWIKSLALYYNPSPSFWPHSPSLQCPPKGCCWCEKWNHQCRNQVIKWAVGKCKDIIVLLQWQTEEVSRSIACSLVSWRELHVFLLLYVVLQWLWLLYWVDASGVDA